jgi:hypothetical protein
LIEVLTLLNEQTQQKLAGQRHIANRLVSLDDLDARPIQKGKSHPKTEFGTTLQMTFNRQGFLITTETFIGQPNEKSLYPETLARFRRRMGTYPDGAVTDLGFRSAKNRKLHHDNMAYIFMGKAQMWTRPIKRHVARRARPPKASLPWPRTCGALAKASTVAWSGPPSGADSTSVPTT